MVPDRKQTTPTYKFSKIIPYQYIFTCIYSDCCTSVLNPYRNKRGVEQLVARRAHNPEAGGSSPSPATKMPQLLSSQRVAALITKRVRQICAKNFSEPWRSPRLLPDALQKKCLFKKRYLSGRLQGIPPQGSSPASAGMSSSMPMTRNSSPCTASASRFPR